MSNIELKKNKFHSKESSFSNGVKDVKFFILYAAVFYSAQINFKMKLENFGSRRKANGLTSGGNDDHLFILDDLIN